MPATGLDALAVTAGRLSVSLRNLGFRPLKGALGEYVLRQRSPFAEGVSKKHKQTWSLGFHEDDRVFFLLLAVFPAEKRRFQKTRGNPRRVRGTSQGVCRGGGACDHRRPGRACWQGTKLSAAVFAGVDVGRNASVQDRMNWRKPSTYAEHESQSVHKGRFSRQGASQDTDNLLHVCRAGRTVLSGGEGQRLRTATRAIRSQPRSEDKQSERSVALAPIAADR